MRLQLCLPPVCVSLTVNIFSLASNVKHTQLQQYDLLSKTGCRCVHVCVWERLVSQRTLDACDTKREQFFTSKSSLRTSTNTSACDQKSV